MTVVGRIDAFRFWELGDAKRSMDDEKPLAGVIVIVDVVEPPEFRVNGEGLAVMKKPGPVTCMVR